MNPKSPGYRRLRQALRPSGDWRLHEYGDQGCRAVEYAPFINTLPTDDPALCRRARCLYKSPLNTIDDGDRSHIPLIITQETQDREVRRSYRLFNDFEEWDILCPNSGADRNAPNNHVAITTKYAKDKFKGELKSIRQSDGSITLYQYRINKDNRRV